MKHIGKRILSLLFGAVFISSFVACAPSDEGKTENNNGNDQTDNEPAKQEVIKDCYVTGAGGYGAIFDISFDPFDDGIMAAICDMGGLYMSYHSAVTRWERREILGTLSDIEFDEENEGVLWAAGSGLYRSVDHGKTFDLIFPSKDTVLEHGSSYENTGEWIFTSTDYNPTSPLVSIAIDRNSGGNRVFAAQKIEYSGDDKIVIYRTENSNDFERFAEVGLSEFIRLEYDEGNDCLVVVTDGGITEIDDRGKVVWSKEMSIAKQVSNVLSFDSYYDRQADRTTFAFSAYVEGMPHETTALYVTNDLRNESSYLDLIPLLNQKKLKEIKRDTVEIEEDCASYEFYEWVNGEQAKQSLDWEIKYVHVAREGCIYFYQESSSDLTDSGGVPVGETRGSSGYLQYKDGEFKWIYGAPHFYAYDLHCPTWQDYDSSWRCFGMSASKQKEDKFVFSTIGSAYYTENCRNIYSTVSYAWKAVFVAAKDGQGNEEWIGFTDNSVRLKETTSLGMNVTTTYKTAVDPFNSNHVLMACTDIGLIYSFQGSGSWLRTLMTWEDGKLEPMSFLYRNTCYDIEFDKEREGIVYSLWSSRSDMPYAPSSDDFQRTGAFGISYDGGISWTMRHIRADDKVIPYRMDIDYTEHGRDIYIATMGRGFFVSHDLGETFVKMNDGIQPSRYFGDDLPAIFGNEILCCKGGIYAITAASAWAQKPDPTAPEGMAYERALYKWNDSLKKFEEIPLPAEVACIRDIEYSEQEDCLYIGAIGRVDAVTHKKIGGGIYRYKDGSLKQIFDGSRFIWGLALDSKGTLYAAEFRGELYRFSENNTKSELLIGNLFHVLKDINFGKDDKDIYVSTFGGGMYRIILN